MASALQYRSDKNKIYIAVLLFGLVGILLKSIALPASVIVVGRTAVASCALLAILIYRGTGLLLPDRRSVLGTMLLGVTLALHWWSFISSVQVSSVAIALLTAASYPLFVTLLEPVVLKTSLHREDLLAASIVAVGLLLVIPSYDLGNNLTLGALYGIFSGITFAVLSLINRAFVARHSAIKIAFYQNFYAMLVFLPVAATAEFQLGVLESGQLLLLGVVFTAGAHSLFVRGMRAVTAQEASILTCTEPIIGIVAALILLGEYPSVRTVVGGGIILLAVYRSSTSHARRRSMLQQGSTSR